MKNSDIKVKALAEKWYKKLSFPEKYDEEFKRLLETEEDFEDVSIADFDLEGHKDEYSRNVIRALYFCEEASKFFEEKAIPEEIMLDTFSDIRFVIMKYTEIFGKLSLKGLDDWIFLHLSFKLFKVGRLQYQLRGAEGGAEHLGLAEGEPVLAVHIPRGEKLTVESALESFNSANEFFEKYFPEYEYRYFTCHSWMLDKTLCNMLSPDSNIIKFQKLFEHALDVPLDAAFSFVFPYGITRDNVKDFEPKSSLQKNLKDYVLAGGELYYTFGIRKK